MKETYHVNVIFNWMSGRETAFTELLRTFVESESPSDDPAAVNRFNDLLAATLSPYAEIEMIPGEPHGDHLLARFPAKGGTAVPTLVLAHSDTVWPLGTLRTMPFRQAEGRLWGPGTIDIKGGIAIFLFAMQAIRELDLPLPGPVILQVNSDEEIGSPSSRALTERMAQSCRRVLVVEPGAGLTGKLKTSRKGVGDFTLHVAGKAAHAGVDFPNGASAILELARQLDRISRFTDLDVGTTVNPGVISGGTRSNVIPAKAEAEIDIRVTSLAAYSALEQRFRDLAPIDPRCSLTVTGGLNRPPMERSDGVARLYRQAQAIAEAEGFPLEESATGGGSDGNFTAALGIPTLDGLGAVGEGAHAPNESLLLRYVPERVALLAGLLGLAD